MMKKTFFAFLFLLGMMPTVCIAEVLLPLSIKPTMPGPGDNNGNGMGAHPKAPILIPSIAIDDCKLHLYNGCDNTTLKLISSDEIEVFSIEIEEGTTFIDLPTTLSENYRLEIHRGTYTFYCYIEL